MDDAARRSRIITRAEIAAGPICVRWSTSQYTRASVSPWSLFTPPHSTTFVPDLYQWPTTRTVQLDEEIGARRTTKNKKRERERKRNTVERHNAQGAAGPRELWASLPLHKYRARLTMFVLYIGSLFTEPVIFLNEILPGPVREKRTCPLATAIGLDVLSSGYRTGEIGPPKPQIVRHSRLRSA